MGPKDSCHQVNEQFGFCSPPIVDVHIGARPTNAVLLPLEMSLKDFNVGTYNPYTKQNQNKVQFHEVYD